MTAVSEDEINNWDQAIVNLHATVATEPADERAAREAAANLWSEFGYRDAPADVVRMLVHAIEIGYITALRDLRNGGGDRLTEPLPRD
ncbi:hypothetical protein [Saccharothrix sp. ALI-22-I]|uniref:hypothetical protein n=1 Tax=Saccharothrix sp. ALI-22-I TaxID=1933778 RepID=UPI00117B7A61|nr:hypothetical protein [Saccharothrix sp. ALI-22-I]